MTPTVRKLREMGTGNFPFYPVQVPSLGNGAAHS